ncbi:MAG: hypothetical protein AB7P14_10485 [Blastocatellales bacterium]
MVEEMVVTDSLSAEMISAGEKLINNLDKAKFIVSAALWLYLADADKWRFVLASPEARIYGPKKAYKQILAVINKMPVNESKIPLKDISVTDSKDPLISLLKVAVTTAPNALSGIRFRNVTINGTAIDDAHIYRLS